MAAQPAWREDSGPMDELPFEVFAEGEEEEEEEEPRKKKPLPFLKRMTRSLMPE